MRKRMTIVLACLTAALTPPATASAAISRLDFGAQAELGPEGTFVEIPVTYQCDFFEGDIYINVRVSQSRGNRMADGWGFISAQCNGATQTALVRVQTSSFPVVPYHAGKAVAEAFASTSSGVQTSDDPAEIQITN